MTLLGSTAFRSAGAAAGLGIAYYAASVALAALPSLGRWTPAGLFVAASDLVAGVDRFLLRKLAESPDRRVAHWRRDFSTPAAYERSIEPNRARLRHILGLRDPRIPFAGRNKMFVIALATMMIPFPVVMVPIYCLFRWVGWIGTLRPLWVGSFLAGALHVFLLRPFFITIPK